MKRVLCFVRHSLRPLVLILGLGMLVVSCNPSTSGVYSPLPSATSPGTAQSPLATSTPQPTPQPTAASSTLTPTPFEPPTRPPTVTPLPLPIVTPSDPAFDVWVMRPTYSEPPPFLRVEFEITKWELTSENPAYPVLAHRELPSCQIAPDVGRGLPEDYSISTTFEKMDNIAYQVNAISCKGELIYINYCALDIIEDVSTCLGVSFQNDREKCIEDAETVLATLQLVSGSNKAQ